MLFLGKKKHNFLRMPPWCSLWPCDGNQTLPIDPVCDSSLWHSWWETIQWQWFATPWCQNTCPGCLNVASAVAQSDVWHSMLNGLLAGRLAVGLRPLNAAPDCSWIHAHIHKHDHTQKARHIDSYWCIHTHTHPHTKLEVTGVVTDSMYTRTRTRTTVWALFSLSISPLTPVSRVHSKHRGHRI